MFNYTTGVAKQIKIGIIGTGKLVEFLKTDIFDAIKIHSDFEIKFEICNVSAECQHYNYIFYLTKFEKIQENVVMDDLKKISKNLNMSRNHLFVVVDECREMELDDEDDLIFTDKKKNKIMTDFDDKLSKIMDFNMYHICKISLDITVIYKLLSRGSLSDLSKKQTKILTSELSITEAQIKRALKKMDMEEKLVEIGHHEFMKNVKLFFRLPYQKKMVFENYLFYLRKIEFGIGHVYLQNFKTFFEEIYNIFFLKSEMLDDLCEKIKSIFMEKWTTFFESLKSFDSIEELNKFLSEIIQIFRKKNIPITKFIENETEKIKSKYSYKESIPKTTDIREITKHLNVSNINDVLTMFDTGSKIIQDNIERTNDWILFVNKCINIEVPFDGLLKIMENIIVCKINYYANEKFGFNTRVNDISILYPTFLQTFLISNINKHFIFKKLLIIVFGCIRYSGKNFLEIAKNINENDYENLLELEHKLLQIIGLSDDNSTDSKK